jgi:L-lactate permease
MPQILKTIFVVSDLLFPLWLIGFMFILKRKGVRTWKAWIIASTFCLVQAYLIAKTVGWNLGGYLIVFVSSVPSIVLGKEIVSEEITTFLFWIIPPLVYIIMPAFVLFLREKRKEGKEDC